MKFKLNVTLFPNVMKIDYGLRYNLHNESRLYAESSLVHSFHHKSSEYYKFDQIRVGIRRNLGNIKCDVGATFKYFKIDHFHIAFRYFRMSIHIPIFVENDLLTVAGLSAVFLGMAALLWAQKDPDNKKKE